MRLSAQNIRFTIAALAASLAMIVLGYWGLGLVVMGYFAWEKYLDNQAQIKERAARRPIKLDERGIHQDDALGEPQLMLWSSVNSLSLVCSEALFPDPWFGYGTESDWIFRAEVAEGSQIISVEYDLVTPAQIAQILAYLQITDTIALQNTLQQIDRLYLHPLPKPASPSLRWDWAR